MRSIDEKTDEAVQNLREVLVSDAVITTEDTVQIMMPFFRIVAAAANYVICKQSLTESQSRSDRGLRDHERALIREVLQHQSKKTATEDDG